METYSSILAWKIPWNEESGKLQSMRVTKELDMTQSLNNNNKYIYVETSDVKTSEIQKTGHD